MKGKLEYHLFARFPSNSGAVRIGVFFTERSVQKIGGEIFEFADEVFYRIKVRRPDTRPYRKPKHWAPIPKWRSTL